MQCIKQGYSMATTQGQCGRKKSDQLRRNPPSQSQSSWTCSKVKARTKQMAEVWEIKPVQGLMRGDFIHLTLLTPWQLPKAAQIDGRGVHKGSPLPEVPLAVNGCWGRGSCIFQSAATSKLSMLQ